MGAQGAKGAQRRQGAKHSLVLWFEESDQGAEQIVRKETKKTECVKLSRDRGSRKILRLIHERVGKRKRNKVVQEVEVNMNRPPGCGIEKKKKRRH